MPSSPNDELFERRSEQSLSKESPSWRSMERLSLEHVSAQALPQLELSYGPAERGSRAPSPDAVPAHIRTPSEADIKQVQDLDPTHSHEPLPGRTIDTNTNAVAGPLNNLLQSKGASSEDFLPRDLEGALKLNVLPDSQQPGSSSGASLICCRHVDSIVADKDDAGLEPQNAEAATLTETENGELIDEDLAGPYIAQRDIEVAAESKERQEHAEIGKDERDTECSSTDQEVNEGDIMMLGTDEDRKHFTESIASQDDAKSEMIGSEEGCGVQEAKKQATLGTKEGSEKSEVYELATPGREENNSLVDGNIHADKLISSVGSQSPGGRTNPTEEARSLCTPTDDDAIDVKQSPATKEQHSNAPTEYHDRDELCGTGASDIEVEPADGDGGSGTEVDVVQTLNGVEGQRYALDQYPVSSHINLSFLHSRHRICRSHSF